MCAYKPIMCVYKPIILSFRSVVNYLSLNKHWSINPFLSVQLVYIGNRLDLDLWLGLAAYHDSKHQSIYLTTYIKKERKKERNKEREREKVR